MIFGKIIVDGVQIEDTDFSKFTRLCHLTTWSKRVGMAVKALYRSAETGWAFRDYHDELIESTRDRLIDEMRAREGGCRARNLDLKVVKTYPKEWTQEDIDGSPNAFDIGKNNGRSPSEIVWSDFVRAEEMSNYEFAAYAILGDEECDRQGIDTLYDMFGTEFATTFFKRRKQLIAQSEMFDLYKQRDALAALIAETEALAAE
jgi:hypothetical protein